MRHSRWSPTLISTMTSRTLLQSVFLASAALLGPAASATDLRLDVATDNNNGSNAFFGSTQLTNLNFRSVNGHDIEQGNANHQSTIQAAGNTLGVYYNNFSSDYTTPPTPPTPASEASAIQTWVHSDFGSTKRARGSSSMRRMAAHGKAPVAMLIGPGS